MKVPKERKKKCEITKDKTKTLACYALSKN